MEENLSWRARLARRNINVLNVDDDRHRWYYEFMYHPYAGQTKWCKTFMDIDPEVWPTDDDVATELQGQVLNLRKELER